tara:strand:- start:2848 stop:3597 length:750 start_codon:yes stop_codon:yes gene_type:complete
MKQQRGGGKRFNGKMGMRSNRFAKAGKTVRATQMLKQQANGGKPMMKPKRFPNAGRRTVNAATTFKQKTMGSKTPRPMDGKNNKGRPQRSMSSEQMMPYRGNSPQIQSRGNGNKSKYAPGISLYKALRKSGFQNQNMINKSNPGYKKFVLRYHPNKAPKNKKNKYTKIFQEFQQQLLQQNTNPKNVNNLLNNKLNLKQRQILKKRMLVKGVVSKNGMKKGVKKAAMSMGTKVAGVAGLAVLGGIAALFR